ncbi:uncharacterized protein LOC144447518 [Glandiceps talaboti]
MKRLGVILLLASVAVVLVSTAKITKRGMSRVTRATTDTEDNVNYCLKCIIKFDFIKGLVGFDTTAHAAYDEDNNLDESRGIIIGNGIDLRRKTATYFVELGLPQNLVTQLTPYLGLTGNAAVQKLQNDPLTLTDGEAEELSNLAMEKDIDVIEGLYDDAVEAIANPDLKMFLHLTCVQKTVIASIYFQYGGPPNDNFPEFWGFVTNQKWPETIQNLRNFGDKYPTRRGKEATLLESENGKIQCRCKLGKGLECGDPHITTFDGRRYDYQGVCSYILFTDGCGNRSTTFRVESITEPGMMKGQAISRVSGVTIRLNVGEPNEKIINLSKYTDVLVNGKTVAAFPHILSSDISLEKSYENQIRVRAFGRFAVTWDGHATIQTYLYNNLHGKICGLLGDADGDDSNDLRMPDGRITDNIHELGKSWEVPGSVC